MRMDTLRGGTGITELGLGTSQFGNLGRVVTDEEAASAVEAAWRLGVRYFDTAPHYGLGLSERRLGRLLASHPRDDYVLSTKVGRLLTANPHFRGQSDDQGFEVPADVRRVWDFSADGVRRSLDDSLERLGIDRMDIAYLHDPDEHWEEAITGAVPALIQLREEGVLGAVGVGMNQAEMLTEFVRRADIDVVMVAGRYTLLDRSAARELLPLANARGVSVVAAGVYNSGLLASSVPKAAATYDYQPASRVLLDRAADIAAVCRNHGVTLPDAAIAFPLRDPAVRSVVVGCRNAAQVDAAVARHETVIPESLWEELAACGLLSSEND